MRARLAVLALFAFASCAESTDDICTQAARHAAECNGVEAAPPPSCDGDEALLAQQVLTSSCADLQSDAKADGDGDVGTAICIALGVPLFVTGLQSGDLCCFDWNCQGELICRSHGCRMPNPRGGDCERNGHCEDGLVCASHLCRDPFQAGERCEPYTCAWGLVCGVDDVCVPPGVEGDHCTGDEMCESGRCKLGACATVVDWGDTCGGNRVCFGDLVCENGTCADPPASGVSCDRSVAFSCAQSETCWDGTCQTRHGAGGACENMFDCRFGLFCTDGLCNEL